MEKNSADTTEEASADTTEEAIDRLSELLINLDSNLEQIKRALAYITEQIDEEDEESENEACE